MSPQFSAGDIMKLLRKSDLDALTRKTQGTDPCEHCGEYHVSDFGGQVHCKKPSHHFAHSPEWCEPMDPLSAQEEAALKSEIIFRKNESYPGGYQKWCEDREIPKEKR